MGSYWDSNGKLVDGRYEALIRSSGGIEPYIGSTGDGEGSVPILYVTARGTTFNETTWDRQRGNTQGTLLASAARTAGTPSPIQTNYNARGVFIIVRISTASGTGGLQVKLRGYDPVSNSPYDLTAYTTLTTTASVFAVELYPGATTAAVGSVGAVSNRYAASLPRTWDAYVNAGDVTSYTYSVGYSLIL